MPPLTFPGVVGTRWHAAAMRYSVNVPNFGEFVAPGVFADVARRAEEAGWDALLVWDHVVEQKDLRREIADPWILLTAAALATRRIRLGTAITPVARRRPSKLAREVATLDRLTGGRMVLGAGLGAPVHDEYASFGDTTDTRVLAERLDEGLHALDLLWSGEPVTYRGNQITIDDVVFLRGCRAENGLADKPFDIVIGGMSPAGRAAGHDLVGPLADLGITWWDERMPWDHDLERAEPIMRRIEQGPPRI